MLELIAVYSALLLAWTLVPRRSRAAFEPAPEGSSPTDLAA